MAEYVYCAVNDRNKIQWVEGSSSKTKYFVTANYLNRAVKNHNRRYGDDPWRVARFELKEDYFYEPKEVDNGKADRG